MRGVGPSTFFLGALSGLLLALIAQELWPRGAGDLEQYAAVRDFARGAFVRDVSDEELLDHALHGMLAGLDPYSRYYDREEARGLERETAGRYRGIGVVFRRPVARGEVLYPLAGSPAARAGVRVGDRFVAIDGRPVESMTESELRGALRDPSGAALAVRLVGLDGEERELSIVPDSIVDPSVRHVRMLDEERGVGYLAISSFSGETHKELDRAFEFLQRRGMRGLVMDLRHNFGGVLEAAVRIAGRFVDEGTIVSTEGRGDPVVYRAENGAARYARTPLVVLVDGDTASASEVLAGALQDHRVAVIVGAPTYGKGMVQTIRHFDQWGTRAKVTSSYYYSPTRRNFERTADPGRDYGILPDVAIPLLPDEERDVHAFLENYSPGPEAIPAIEAWEASEGRPLVDPPPEDAQLAAALELFEGRRPGSQPLER